MTWTGMQWQGNEPHLTQESTIMKPGANAPAVRRWVAPRPGTVKITGWVLYSPSGCGDDATVEIAREYEELWSASLANGDTSKEFDVETAVNEGTSISFVVGKGSGSEQCDTVYAYPTIHFTAAPKATFVTFDDFRSMQGYRGWYFGYGDPANPTPMTWNGTKWQGNESNLVQSNNEIHPGANSPAIRRWMAPESGEARIKGKVLDANGSCGDGVRVRITGNDGIPIWSVAIANGDTEGKTFDLTIPVVEGGAISVIVDKGSGDNACDATFITEEITFEAGDRPPSPGLQFSDEEGWRDNPMYWQTIQSADVNGDGKPDVCGRLDTGIYCALSKGITFARATRWIDNFKDIDGWADPAYGQTIRFPDVNNDGKADVCGRGVYGILCALSEGTSFGPATYWSSDYRDPFGWKNHPSHWKTIQFPDLNSDGKADVCGRGGAGLICALSNGASFGPTTVWSSFYSNDNQWNIDPAYWQTIQFADLNGDRKADVCGRGGAGPHCALSNGSSFGPTSPWAYAFTDADNWYTSPAYWQTIKLVDVSGDKKADICGRGIAGVYCAISNGTGFGPASAWINHFTDAQLWNTDPSYWKTVQFPDINADGKADVCGRGLGGVVCATSTGAGFGSPVLGNDFYSDLPWKDDPSYGQSIMFPDMNGDGMADVCGRGLSGLFCGISIDTVFPDVIFAVP